MIICMCYGNLYFQVLPDRFGCASTRGQEHAGRRRLMVISRTWLDWNPAEARAGQRKLPAPYTHAPQPDLFASSWSAGDTARAATRTLSPLLRQRFAPSVRPFVRISVTSDFAGSVCIEYAPCSRLDRPTHRTRDVERPFFKPCRAVRDEIMKNSPSSYVAAHPVASLAVSVPSSPTDLCVLHPT